MANGTVTDASTATESPEVILYMDVQADPLSAASLSEPLAPPAATASPISLVANAPLDQDDAATIKQGIITFLCDVSQPAPQQSGWKFLESTDDIRRLTIDPSELEFQFKRRFTEPQIDAAGRLVGESILAPLSRLLGNADHTFLVVRDENKCVDICTDSALPLFGKPPAIAAALRRVDSKSKTNSVPLLLAETLCDLQVLRGLGFHSELSFGLQLLDAASIEQLFAADDINEPWMYHSLIANWNISTLGPTNRPGALAIAKRLSRMQGLYGHDPGRRFSHWKPKTQIRSAIKHAHDFGDVGHVRKLITSSFPQQQLGNAWHYHIDPVPVSYHAARMHLVNELMQSSEIPSIAKVKTALDEFRKVARAQVTDQFYAKAEHADSPMARLMVHQAAESYEQWFETQAIVEAAKTVIAGRHPGNNWQVNADDGNERMVRNSKMFTMLAKLLSIFG